MATSRSAVFAPLGQLGRVEAVTQRLTEAITLGLLAEDEQLPSEAELASQFGVSTVTIREALTTLRGQGLVQTRRGRGGGSFVCRADASHDPVAERLRAMTLTDIRDLGDHYLAIASTAARLAAERASEETVSQLDQLAEAPAGDRLAVHRAERDFHLEVAAAAQSPRLTIEEMRLQNEFGALLWLPAPGSEPDAGSHQAIAAAIRDADPDAAREHTERHVLLAVQRLGEAHLRLA